MLRGRPPLKDIRLNFTKITETDKFGRTTPRQKCIHCEEDFVDIVSRLKEHFYKCKKLPKSIKNSLSNINTDTDLDEDKMPLTKLDVDQKLARFFYSSGIPFTAIETPFWEEFIDAVHLYIKKISPFYISPNRHNLANNLLDSEYEVGQQNLAMILEEATNIMLVSDGWTNI